MDIYMNFYLICSVDNIINIKIDYYKNRKRKQSESEEEEEK